MNPTEIRLLVRGILSCANSESDHEKRDIGCFKAILNEPALSLVFHEDVEFMIGDLLETCYDNNLNRLLTAAQATPVAAHLNNYPQDQMRARVYIVCLGKLCQIDSPTINDLKMACTVYCNIGVEMTDNAEKLLRQLVRIIGPGPDMDEFVGTLNDHSYLQEIIVLALLEIKGAFEIWKHLQSTFSEEYENFASGCDAEETKTTIEELVTLEPNPQIVQKVLDLISCLKIQYKNPSNAEQWFMSETKRAKWWKHHVDVSQPKK